MTDPSRTSVFDVAAEGYDRLMGRYLPILGPALADAAGVAQGQRVLDVGCGPGGLTRVLVERVGDTSVAAIDPSGPFVSACRQRNPGVDVRQGVAEHLPWNDATFDASLASLVVGFMTDPVAGLAEMRRVTRPGGRVGTCFWTMDMPVLSVFWGGVREVDGPDVEGAAGELDRIGRRQGELVGVLEAAGLTDVVETRLETRATYADFEDWWSSYTGGAGPVGAYQVSLTPDRRARVRAACARLLGDPDGPFTLQAYAWCAVGTV